MRFCPQCDLPTDAGTCPKCALPTVAESMLRERDDPLLGRTVAGRYKVLELLGRGGMANVYVAEQLAMQRQVALKVIRAAADADRPDRLAVVKRFQREALAASRLEHPNTVRVFDFGVADDDTMFLAMELLKGPTLAKAMAAGGPMSPRRAVRIAIQVCRSLAEAHEQGIIHRDLKPDNILLIDVAGEKDFVKVLDFGIAKVAMGNPSEPAITRTGLVIGTPAYMAPEQGTGGGVTGATDLYSLGVILYEALSGRLPFQSELPLALLMKHVSAVVPPLVVDQHPPDVPQALNDLVFRLLEKDPAKRPSTAMELAGLLSEIDFQGPKAGRPLPVTTVARRLAGRFDAASAAIPVSRVTGETAAAPAGTLQPPGKHPLGPVALLTRRGGRWWRPVVVALIVALWVAVGVIAFALRQSL